MRKFRKTLFPALFVVLVLAFSAFSQPGAIKTEYGFLFVVNEKDKSLTFEIRGKEVKSLKGSVPMFMVDGKVLQILIVKKSNFVKNDKKLTDEELLEAHKVWESDYLSKEVYDEKLSIESEKLAFGDRQALFWGFKRPGENKNFDRDYFLTTNMGNYLLGLGSPVAPTQEKAEIQKFLSGLMDSLKVSDKPYDLEKLSEEIRLSSKDKTK